MSYAIIWTYDIAPEHEAAFRAAYGPNGGWAQLFARAPGFVSVELLHDGARYATIDRWETPEAFQAFQAAHGADYAALDAKLAHLTRAQQRAGAFTVVQ
jgi:heme-degrading monooxygenase HmoA